MYANRDFLVIDTLSGYIASSLAPRAVQRLLAPQVAGAELGSALVDALSNSRVVKFAFAPDLYDGRDGHAQRYRAGIEGLMKHGGCKTRIALFKSLKHCGIHPREGDTFTFTPSRHVKL